ncbi:hypothetical protein AB3N59_14875 [Leptospira sp. WS92.C1]
MSDTHPSLNRKVLLFLSVDIVGSTEYKNKSETQNNWLRFFTTFYKDFPITFYKKFEEINNPNLQKPEIWKSLGDELIFRVEITDHISAKDTVRAFSQALFSYSLSIRTTSLALKGSAWIAGFPVINAEIYSDEEGKQVVDYIGPQMDIGFRISKFASEYKFIISIELLLLLSATTDSYFKFFLEEPQILKGVLKNRPYPIIWMKNENAVENNLFKLLNKHNEECKTAELNDYCKSFLNSAGKPFMIPFLKFDSLFNELPFWYEEELKNIQEVLTSNEDNFGEENLRD